MSKNLVRRYAIFCVRRWLIIVPIMLAEHIADRRVSQTHTLKDIDRRDAVVNIRKAVFVGFWIKDAHRIITWFRR